MRYMGDSSTTPLTSTTALNNGQPPVVTTSSAAVPGTNVPATVSPINPAPVTTPTPATTGLTLASLNLTQPPLYYAAILAAVFLLIKG